MNESNGYFYFKCTVVYSLRYWLHALRLRINEAEVDEVGGELFPSSGGNGEMAMRRVAGDGGRPFRRGGLSVIGCRMVNGAGVEDPAVTDGATVAGGRKWEEDVEGSGLANGLVV